METIKDLTPEFQKLAAKDKFYEVEINVDYLLAPQEARWAGYFMQQVDPWGAVEFPEELAEGTSKEEMREPAQRRRVRQGKPKTNKIPLWKFRVLDGKLYVEWGGMYGLFKQGVLNRVLVAIKKNRYWTPSFELMKVYPKWLSLGDAPADSEKDGYPQVVLQTRNLLGGKTVRVPVAFEYIRDRKIKTILRTDGENPTKDMILSTLKGMNYFDGWGPARRGSGKAITIKEVSLNDEEIQHLEEEYKRAEPTIIVS